MKYKTAVTARQKIEVDVKYWGQHTHITKFIPWRWDGWFELACSWRTLLSCTRCGWHQSRLIWSVANDRTPL